MNTLKRKYRDPKVGLTGKRAFIDVVSDDESEVERTLSEDPIYSQFRPIRRKFKRYHFYSGDIDFLWSADLMDMRNCAADNKDIYYCLVSVDAFTRFMRVQPVKRKSSSYMIAAFKQMITSEHTPRSLFTDRGKEFVAKPVQEYFDSQAVHHYTSNDADIKASHAERAIRTLRERLVRLFAANGSKAWLHSIQQIVNHYNDTICEVHGYAPSTINHTNCLKVYKILYPDGYALPKKPAKYKVGELVRISKARKAFQKTGKNYSDELFKIVKVVPRFEVYMYELKSEDDNETIQGKFYAEELVRVTKPRDQVYAVEKILSTKRDKKTGKKLYLVKYVGFSDAHNTWEPEENVGQVADM